jgi:hypothetical protein
MIHNTDLLSYGKNSNNSGLPEKLTQSRAKKKVYIRE